MHQKLGGLGFDMEGVTTRLAVYRERKALHSFTDPEVQELMDGGIPFHPEECNYQNCLSRQRLVSNVLITNCIVLKYVV